MAAAGLAIAASVGIVGPSPAGGNVSTPSTCVGTARDRRGASVAWKQLTNPVFALADRGAKDEAIRLVRGRWHLLFSVVSGNPVHWAIGRATSQDLKHWSATTVWPDQPGTEGVASPDIAQRPDGTYVVTYTSVPREIGGEAKAYSRTSKDLEHFSEPRPLARTLHPSPDDRVIDPALAYTGHGLVLASKYGLEEGTQAFEIAFSASGALTGPWQTVGRPTISAYAGTFENYQLVANGARWLLVATTNNLDRPWLATLAGPPTDPQSWLRWTGGHEIAVPEEAWNHGTGLTGDAYERANSAYLCDARRLDGHYYLFYAGSTELTAFGGWGHAKIGVARSTDLVHWQVP